MESEADKLVVRGLLPSL